jgi:CAAX protease family protein
VRNNSISERSPNSPASWPTDAFPPAASFAALCGLVIIYLVTLVVLLRGFGVTHQAVRSAQLTPALVAAQILGYVPVILYLSIVLPRLARRTFSAIVGRFGAREALAGFSGALLMWFAVISVGALQSAIFRHPPEQLAVRLFEGARPGLLLDLMILVAVALAPFTEELVFRGFIFNAIWRRTSLRAAATLSGLVFGVAHGELAGVLPLAAGGIVLAYVYARSGSLWSSIIAHGAFNGITLLLLLAAGIKT